MNILKKNKICNNHTGFTIVELLIAMAVFQVVLIATVVAYMQISRYYQKAINANRLQQTANNVVEDIARSIQNTGGLVAGDFFTAIDVSDVITDKSDTKVVRTNEKIIVGTTEFNVLCVDNVRYVYQISTSSNIIVEAGGDPMVDIPHHVLMSDTITSPSACLNPDFGKVNPRLLFAKDTILYGFGVTNISGTSLYTVHLNAAYTSEDDDVDKTDFKEADQTGYVACKGGSGRQYCAVANVNTTVVRRIGL